jgi:hypothetical protein
LKYGGTSSRLAPALERARDELAGLPLAGLVLVTDGADTSDEALDESIAALKAPVRSRSSRSASGRESFERDVQITRRRDAARHAQGHLPRRRQSSSARPATAAAPFRCRWKTTGGLSVRRRSSSRLTAKRRPCASTSPADAPGPRIFRFKIPAQRDEQVTQNNNRDALVEVLDRVEKALYIEGEPRPEYKFIGRAVQDDKNLQVVRLLRTAQDKYYRQDVGGRRGTGRRLPENARGAVPVPRADSRQRRSRVVFARAAADAGRFRQQARRRAS